MKVQWKGWAVWGVLRLEAEDTCGEVVDVGEVRGREGLAGEDQANLVPDEATVFAAAARALRPGGRLAIVDIVSSRTIAEGTRAQSELWAACIARAVRRAGGAGRTPGFSRGWRARRVARPRPSRHPTPARAPSGAATGARTSAGCSGACRVHGFDGGPADGVLGGARRPPSASSSRPGGSASTVWWAPAPGQRSRRPRESARSGTGSTPRPARPAVVGRRPRR